MTYRYMYWYRTCVRAYFRPFVVSFKKFQHFSFLAGAGVGSGWKIPGARAVPKQAGSETLLQYEGNKSATSIGKFCAP